MVLAISDCNPEISLCNPLTMPFTFATDSFVALFNASALSTADCFASSTKFSTSSAV